MKLEDQYALLEQQHKEDQQKQKKEIAALLEKIEFLKKKENWTPEELLSIEKEQELMRQIEQKNQQIIELEEQIILQKDQKEFIQRGEDHSITESIFSIDDAKKTQQIYGTNLRKTQEPGHELCYERMKELRKQIEQLETHNNLLQN